MNSELDTFIAEIEGTAKRYANLRVLYDTLYGILHCLPDDAEVPYLGTCNVDEEIGWEDDRFDYAVQVNLSIYRLRIEMKDGVISLFLYDPIKSVGGEWNTIANIVEKWPRVNQVEIKE